MCKYVESTDNISVIIVEFPGMKKGDIALGGVTARRAKRAENANSSRNTNQRGNSNFSKFVEAYANEDTDEYGEDTDRDREGEENGEEELGDEYRAIIQRFYESGNLDAFQTDRDFLDLEEAEDVTGEDEDEEDDQDVVFDTEHGIEEVTDEDEEPVVGGSKDGNEGNDNDTI